MARFDVYKFNSSSVPLVVSVQADMFDEIHSRVVIPLVPEAKNKKEAVTRLKPVLNINGKNYILMTTDIGSLKASDLGNVIDNVDRPYRQTITDALDFLFQGF